MKKKIAHIIYQLLSFLFAYLIHATIKDVKDENEKDAFDFIIIPVVFCCAILVFSCLWRQSVFRCGSSALIHLKGCKRIHEYAFTGRSRLREA